jgi:3-oxoacyl-(acyl-carrier-protein) synthase
VVLDRAGWEPSRVDYLAATGSGLPHLDQLEAEAYAEVFGADLGGTALGVHTGVTGFTEAAHGPLGLVGALQAMHDGRVPPTVGLGSPRPPLVDAVVRATPHEREVRRALVVSLAPEGQGMVFAIERL